MKQLETVYHESYSGIGASRFLLPHGICDAKNMIKQLHNIVRLVHSFVGGAALQFYMYRCFLFTDYFFLVLLMTISSCQCMASSGLLQLMILKIMSP